MLLPPPLPDAVVKPEDTQSSRAVAQERAVTVCH